MVEWNPKVTTGGFDQLFVIKWYQDTPVYDSCMGSFRLYSTKYNPEKPFQMYCGTNILDIKVVGNIFNNPELL